MMERLQKVLAQTGLASRRQIESWISAGRITVNGKLAKLGDKIDSKAKICVDGKPISIQMPTQELPRVILYNKPEGEVCTRADEKGRTTVFASLPKLQHGRWVMVGRLDINSAGVLLFTNDGNLANILMHPKTGLEKEYLVRVLGKVTPEILRDLQHGVVLEDGMAKFTAIKRLRKDKVQASNQWFKVVVIEGRNRIVRRLWQAKDLAVSRLVRTRFHSIILPRSLAPGKYLELDESTVKKLLALKEC